MENLRWHGIGETLKVGPFDLKDPMVYSANSLKSQEPSAILTSKRLRSADETNVLRSGVHSYYAYHASYEDFNMQEKWRYLNWLAQGRPATRTEGYLLLFLSGLERRTIVEGYDIPIIWQELYRLYHLNSESLYNFRYSAKQLLWFLIPKAPETVSVEQIQYLSEDLNPLSQWTSEPEICLSLLLWWCARQLGAIPQWMAYQCARVSMESRRTVVVERASEELKQLFALRFNEVWGESIPIALPPKAKRCIEYSIRNRSIGSIDKTVTVSWPDPLKLTSAWKKIDSSLATIYNECQQDLRPLAILLGKEGITRTSASAWEATPKELRPGEHPSRARLMALGGVQLQKTGFYATHIGAIAKLFDVPEREFLTPIIAKRLAESLQNCGFGIEPDARLTGKSLKWDDSTVIFPLATGFNSVGSVLREREVDRYQTCVFLLKLAFYVAQAAGSVSQSSLTLIASTLSKLFNWNELDQKRFKALAGLALWRGVETSGIRAPAHFYPFDKDVIKQLLLKLVASERSINRSQEDALRFVWKRLDLDNRNLNSEFDALSQNGIIFIGQHTPSALGEKIPPPPDSNAPQAPLQLDHAAIAALLEDTHHVQATLGAAMVDSERAEETFEPIAEVEPDNMPTFAPEIVPELVKTDSDFAGLKPRFSPLLRELLGQDSWSEAEAKGLAQRHSVMLSGALEAINDWAFEEWGTALIWEEDGNLTVERAVLD